MRNGQFRFAYFTPKYEETVAFYRQGLELPTIEAWDRTPDDRGTLFAAASGVIEVLALPSNAQSDQSLLIIIRKILKEKQKRLESQLINNRIKVNYQNYERINEAHRQIRYVYHDLKNHLLCLKNFQTKAEIEDYITNLELQIGGFEDFRDTGNRTLDIILGEKIYRCKKMGLNMRIIL